MITEKQMVEMYMKGASAYEIMKYTTYKAPHSIYKILRRHGVEIRTKAGSKGMGLKEDYFRKIDSEKKAYFLGFIYADGSILRRVGSKTAIRLEIKQSDQYLLDILKQELNSTNVISIVRKGCARFSVHSNVLEEDLARYSIVPDKSHRQDEIVILPEPFMHHFIRGVFDGDGWIFKRKYSLTFGLCGTQTAMCQIADYLQTTLDLPKVQVKQYGDKVPFFTHSAKVSTLKLFSYLYKDATIYLKRKYSIFSQVCQYREGSVKSLCKA